MKTLKICLIFFKTASKTNMEVFRNFLRPFLFCFLISIPSSFSIPAKGRESSGVVLLNAPEGFGHLHLEEQQKELRCIKEALAYEAFGEPIEGIEAVLSVIVNRKNKTKQTFCQVIRKPKQFSYRNSYSKDEYLPMERFKSHEKYASIVTLAHSAYVGNFRTTLPPETLYFIGKSKKVHWNKHKMPVVVIGGHSFYK